MTLILVMLHTGTMFAVIVYFRKMWMRTYFSGGAHFKRFLGQAVWATFLTGIVGEALKILIVKTYFHSAPQAQIEMLFGQLQIIAPALFAVGLLILAAGLVDHGRAKSPELPAASLDMRQAGWMGIVQGLALPFRGFSRSGATISTGIVAGATREAAERFSFAMAVILTPVVDGIELRRLVKAAHAASATGVPIDLHASLLASGIGAAFSFIAGLIALRWLSNWLESGRWHWFGIYCLAASAAVLYLHLSRGL